MGHEVSSLLHCLKNKKPLQQPYPLSCLTHDMKCVLVASTTHGLLCGVLVLELHHAGMVPTSFCNGLWNPCMGAVHGRC